MHTLWTGKGPERAQSCQVGEQPGGEPEDSGAKVNAGSASQRALSRGMGNPLAPRPHGLAVQGWHLRERLCASAVVICLPIKALYKLLSEIIQEGWLGCTAPRPGPWTPRRDARELPGGLLRGARAGQPASGAPGRRGSGSSPPPVFPPLPAGLGRAVAGSSASALLTSRTT